MNPRFCELTGIYWAWKNIVADYVGFVHYRRHFTAKSFVQRFHKNRYTQIISENELCTILKEYDLILPKPRRYYIESLYSHYAHLPYAYEKDIQILRQVLEEQTPEYIEAFDKVMHCSHAHMFNAFIMKQEIFHAYCEWLFPILFEVDRRIDSSNYTPREARVIGYLAEFMLDIWNEKQRIQYYELPFMHMERQNWLNKGGTFLLRKARVMNINWVKQQ
jgi:hypothetical protein